MALTATQKAEARRYLGYSDTSQGAYSLLEGVLVAISAEAEVQVIQILTDLATIETQLRANWPLQKAKRAEEVELWGLEGILALRNEGNRLAMMLASVLGVTVQRLPFSVGSSFGICGRG